MSSTGPPLAFDGVLVAGAEAVLALAGAWGLLLLLAAGVESATAGRVHALRSVGCPAAWRPTLLAALGAAVSVSGVVAGPAHAATRGAEGPDVRPDQGFLPVPARPVDVAPSLLAPRAPRAPVVTVAPGDSLWLLARDRLGDEAAAARVAALTGALHRANRAVIGPDPDLLHPGQRLRVPPTPISTPREDPLP